MDPSQLVGSAAIRGATLLFAAVCAAAVSMSGSSPGAQRLLTWLAIGSGLFAAIGFLHSFQSTYSAWLRFAERLQTVVISILFGACYLLVVPLFRLFTQISDPLRLRRRMRAETFWVLRPEDSDLDSLERMG